MTKLSLQEVAEIATFIAVKHLDNIDLNERKDLKLVSGYFNGQARAWVEKVPLWFWQE